MANTLRPHLRDACPHPAPCWCKECNRAYQKAYRLERLSQGTTWSGRTVPCVICGAPADATSKSRTCSAACRGIAGMGGKKRLCDACGTPFTPTNAHARVCSWSECRRERHRVRAELQYHGVNHTEMRVDPSDGHRALAITCRKRRLSHSGECRWCFTVGALGDDGYCSRACRDAMTRHCARHRTPDRCHLPICMDCLMPFPFKVTKSGNTIHATIRCPACAAANQERSRGKAMARRLHASRLGDNPNWRRLVARDGDRCHICGVHTSTLLGPLDDNYPTVDHLVPIAAGGTDTMDNCKVACRRCNISRGAGPVRKRKQRA